MIAITILLGLLGLGIVIIIHELGHFIAARLTGIQVEAFAVGWGKAIHSFSIHGTEYRLNIFPVGGYCKMKGEYEFRQAIENHLSEFPSSPGSLFSVSPLRRFLTYASGPLANFLSAILLFAAVWGIGYDITTYSNRIVLVSDYSGELSDAYPADLAGLESGDSIVSIDNRDIHSFYDLQSALMGLANTTVAMEYLRDGEKFSTSITPELDPSTGSGIIGIYSWIPAVVTGIPEQSPEQAAGFQEGDRITAVNGEEIAHALDLYMIAAETEAALQVTVLREGKATELTYLPLRDTENTPDIRLYFPRELITNRATGFLDALTEGFKESVGTFSLSVNSIRTLFRGADVSSTLAGPIRITYLVGEVAASGFRAGFLNGMRSLLQLLGFISIALCFANLLPIPALDGGQMIVSIAEGIIRRPLRPRYYYILQIIGFSLLFGLLIFTVINDISSFF